MRLSEFIGYVWCGNKEDQFVVSFHQGYGSVVVDFGMIFRCVAGGGHVYSIQRLSEYGEGWVATCQWGHKWGQHHLSRIFSRSQAPAGIYSTHIAYIFLVTQCSQCGAGPQLFQARLCC
jgi:hypothetical protein